MKLVLGAKQMETLDEVLNLAINFLQGVDEYKADKKRYEALQASIDAQKAKQTKFIDSVESVQSLYYEGSALRK